MFLVIRERFCVLFGDTISRDFCKSLEITVGIYENCLISRDFCKSLEITVGIYENNRSLEILWGVILSVFSGF